MDALLGGFGILAAIIGIGFVIAVHELGHFLAAKWAGVRVHLFSIGFGPVVWSRRLGGTEYALSLLPLGGYVAMQEEPDGNGDSFREASAAWRAAILAAGVLCNLASSFVLLLCLAWYGMPLYPPIVGGVVSELRGVDGHSVPSPALQLGLQVGDRILHLDGREIRAFDDLVAAGVAHGPEPVRVGIERQGRRLELPRPDQEPVALVHAVDFGLPVLGISPPRTRRIAAAWSPTGEVDDLIGWTIEAVAGQPVGDLIGQQVADLLAERSAEGPVTLQLRRGDRRRELNLLYAGGEREQAVARAVGLPVVISHVSEGLPAQRAGLQAGDVLTAIGGVEMLATARAVAALRASAGAPVELDVLRPELGAAEPDLPPGWRRLRVELATEHDAFSGRSLIGVHLAHQHSGELAKPAGALARAGIEPGEVLLALEPLGADGMRVQVLGGGTRVLVPLNETLQRELMLYREPPVLAKFLGVRAPRPVLARVAGGRVEAVSDEAVHVWRPDGQVDVLDLGGLSGPLRRLLAGLQPGDWCIGLAYPEVDGAPQLELRRGAEESPRSIDLDLNLRGTVLAFGLEPVPYRLERWTEAFGLAWHTTGGMITTTLSLIPRFFRSSEDGGVAASKSLHGPIGIFRELKARQEHGGFASLLHLIALLGVNLFLINLLPIPIADGGRLLFLGIESILGRPIPKRVADGVNAVGFVLIVTLMLFVIGLDLLRTFGRH